MMRITSVWRALWALVFVAVLVLVSVVYTLSWSRGDALKIFTPSTGKTQWDGWEGDAETVPMNDQGKADTPSVTEDVSGEQEGGSQEDTHPIEELIGIAEEKIKALQSSEASDLHDAAAKYRKKHGRHPPPGFDAWYAYAVKQGAIVIESFWDQIYHDLAPFWSIEPVLLRKQAHVFSPKLSIRGGKVAVNTFNVYEKLDLWADMLKALANHPYVLLPDIDVAFNVNDEPALLVPWEALDSAVSLTRPMLVNVAEVVTEYSGLAKIEEMAEDFAFDPEWLGPRLTHTASHLGPRPLWSLVRPACPPSSLAREAQVFDDIWDPEGDTSEEHLAAALLPLQLPEGSLKGYKKNWTSTIDTCQQPNLQGLHDAFVAPSAMSVSKKLFPLSGDSKFYMSSEILIPGALEWNASQPSTEQLPIRLWDTKTNTLLWRGPASQGRDPARYWKRSHRHRLVSMLNATHVEIADASIHSGNESTVGVGYAGTFRLLPANDYHLKSQTQGQLAEWVNGWADAAFTDLECDVEAKDDTCPYLDSYLSVAKAASDEQKVRHKYAVVVDGDSGDDGGGLAQTMQSGKVVLRASVYRKWYDNRLIPWAHYAPIDNSFVDMFGVMEYFLGTAVSNDAKQYPHATGEVQKHEHDFKTPDSDNEEGMTAHAHPELVGDLPMSHAPPNPVAPVVDHGSYTGNEPHAFGTLNPNVNNRDVDGHDEAARRIAEASKSWAARVLRREDMLVYMYRLLLEYARVVDDKRDRLGWVGDLTKD